jgi:hypothetical protein
MDDRELSTRLTEIKELIEGLYEGDPADTSNQEDQEEENITGITIRKKKEE